MLCRLRRENSQPCWRRMRSVRQIRPRVQRKRHYPRASHSRNRRARSLSILPSDLQHHLPTPFRSFQAVPQAEHQFPPPTRCTRLALIRRCGVARCALASFLPLCSHGWRLKIHKNLIPKPSNSLRNHKKFMKIRPNFCFRLEMGRKRLYVLARCRTFLPVLAIFKSRITRARTI